MLGMYIKDT